MNAGIDFGTSNCSIGIWKNNAPSLLQLENESTRLPSVIYTPLPHMQPAEVDNQELKTRITREKAEQTQRQKEYEDAFSKYRAQLATYNSRMQEFRKRLDEYNKLDNKKKSQPPTKPEPPIPPTKPIILTEDEIKHRMLGILRRENIEKADKERANQTIESALRKDSEFYFGDEAINLYIENPGEGLFFKSPKSFLGADLKETHIETFSEVISKMLTHIKKIAEQQIHSEITSIVLGRPVEFNSAMKNSEKARGNAQAINILTRSAFTAGFKNIEFLLEPIAAALDYERKLDTNQIALVLDIGGGTTDCTMIKLGPSYVHLTDRTDSILGTAGIRIGGIDLDINLTIKKIMPHFGSESCLKINNRKVQQSIFRNAATTNNVNSQAAFYNKNTALEIDELLKQAIEPQLIKRLERLYKHKLTSRLGYNAETAKISLSNHREVNSHLDFIEKNLKIKISQKDLTDSIEPIFKQVMDIMKEVENQAGIKPDIIYVTGGTANSPTIQSLIKTRYPDTTIIIGDLFGSVTSGLTTWAHRIFQHPPKNLQKSHSA